MNDEFNDGVNAAAAMLDKMADDYALEHGSEDPDTGVWEFGRHGEDYYNTLRELADDIRGIVLGNPSRAQLAPTTAPEAAGGWMPEPFQQRVQPWMMACFGPAISANVVERNHRFLEESLELVQSTGCTQSEAHQLVDYVYGRPAGETAQEVGGVMVTLAALCLAHPGLDMHAAGETELARIWTKVDVIRAKQAAKPAHSPLPGAACEAVAEARPTNEMTSAVPAVPAAAIGAAPQEAVMLTATECMDLFAPHYIAIAGTPSAIDLLCRDIQRAFAKKNGIQIKEPEGSADPGVPEVGSDADLFVGQQCCDGFVKKGLRCKRCGAVAGDGVPRGQAK